MNSSSLKLTVYFVDMHGSDKMEPRSSRKNDQRRHDSFYGTLLTIEIDIGMLQVKVNVFPGDTNLRYQEYFIYHLYYYYYLVCINLPSYIVTSM